MPATPTPPSHTSETSDWPTQLRAAMRVQGVYLDHAACSPLPHATAAAMHGYIDDFTQQGSGDWPRWRRQVEVARKHAAALVGLPHAAVAMVRNTTEGITLIAEGLPWQPGDNVVVPADEFPSNLFPWQNLESRGVEVRIVPSPSKSHTIRLDPQPLAAACDDRTRVVACSWVGYKLGDRADLAALRAIADAHGQALGGTRLFIDAIQGLGMHPLDMAGQGIDFLAADGHKWLLGPEGAGILAIAPGRLHELRPLGVGWNSAREAAAFDSSQMNLRDDAARYEGGTYPAVTMVGLAASLDVLAEVSPIEREAHLMTLTDHLREQLRRRGGIVHSPDDAVHRTAITAVEFPDRDPVAIRQRGLDQPPSHRIVTSVRGGLLRLAPHAYQTPADLDAALDRLGL